MTHWGWYWNIKNRHVPRRLCCSNFGLCAIDSFSMFNDYRKVEGVRSSVDKCALQVPPYDLKAYLQDDDSLLVEYKDGSYVIPVEKMPCNYGGYYYFFHCPRCNKRMRKLYCLKGKYLCRKCGNLAYYKQCLRPKARFFFNGMDVEKYVKKRGGRLKCWSGDFYGSRKPPRMHKKTFQRLKDKVVYYEAKDGVASYKELREWYGAKAEAYLDCFEYGWEMDIKEYENKYKNK